MGNLLDLFFSFVHVTVPGMWRAFRFWRTTGVRISTVRRVFREISTRYLTPSKPGVCSFSDVGTTVTIITSTPRMSVAVNRVNGPSQIFWVNRDTLEAFDDGEERDLPIYMKDKPLDHPSNQFLIDLVKCFARNGVPFPVSDENVRYFRMPGEEEHVGNS